MQLFIVMMGLVTLVYGHRLFWVFIAIAGFLAGLELSRVILVGQPQWLIIVGGCATGITGALLAILFERAAFVLAGFLAGTYITLVVSTSLGFTGSGFPCSIAGGLIGAVLSGMLMDWAIIIMSSLVGASAIMSQLELDPAYTWFLFFGLSIIGAYTQARSRD